MGAQVQLCQGQPLARLSDDSVKVQQLIEWMNASKESWSTTIYLVYFLYPMQLCCTRTLGGMKFMFGGTHPVLADLLEIMGIYKNVNLTQFKKIWWNAMKTIPDVSA